MVSELKADLCQRDGGALASNNAVEEVVTKGFVFINPLVEGLVH